MFDLHNELVTVETTLDQHFNPDEQDLSQELREDVRERAEFLDNSGDLDMTSNKDNIHQLCRPVKIFMETPDNAPVQVLWLLCFCDHGAKPM